MRTICMLRDYIAVRCGLTRYVFLRLGPLAIIYKEKWEFDSNFVDGLTSFYGESFRLGLSNYKSRYLTSWDILRDFFN